MTTYNLNLEDEILKLSFGTPSSNDQIVKDADAAAKTVAPLITGKLLRINGPASLPVAMNLAHNFSHLVPAIACFDPKLGENGKYVVVVSHDPKYKLGDLID